MSARLSRGILLRKRATGHWGCIEMIEVVIPKREASGCALLRLRGAGRSSLSEIREIRLTSAAACTSRVEHLDSLMRFVVGGAGDEPMTLPGRKVKNPLGGLEKTAGVAESQLARTKSISKF
jgi:hypothetical protein